VAARVNSIPESAPGKSVRRRRVRRVLLWIALPTAGLIVLGFIVCSSLERQATFHPSRVIESEPASRGLAGEQVELRTMDGETITGWFVAVTEPVATVLFLHGNAGNMGHRLEDVAALKLAGFSVLIIDYRGYGRSTGSPSEEGIYRDTRAAWEYLVGERRVPAERIVLLGESLGSAAALNLALHLRNAGSPPPLAIVLVGAFTSALDMGLHHFPFLPVRWILRQHLDNLSAVRELDVPLLVIHGQHDVVAPPEMGRRLFEASASRLKEHLEVPMAGHATLVIGGRRVFDKIALFVRRALAGERSSESPARGRGSGRRLALGTNLERVGIQP
jgi:uncharacterized protein